ncbi:endonuclease [Nocardioides iriomotensis]|uniref:Ribonuclease n=1 Tax=Nocardioides iriomotensis TaxID=715784 RepID=A0A4V1Z1R6_9ACTN|nr:endonuclease [Nocardioides iriomotensis]RYU11836.1 ribonuclease [Nocardioides iriomotensis]
MRVLAPFLAFTLVVVGWTTGPAGAAGEITAARAISTQNGSTAEVRGHVVGQPTSSSTVVTSGFPDDYALALADSPGETSTSRMVYVQVPTAFRSQWGLRSNPGLLGDRIDVTGTLTAYFSHAGLKNGTAFAFADGGDGDPPPGGGEYDGTYYASAIGLTGSALKAELHDIVSTGVTRISYDQVWEALKQTDEDPGNAANVVLLYSGRSQSKSSNGGDPDDWNREHVWPQSHGGFGTTTGPGTDLHHLRPEDVTVNGTRGNKDFDDGGSSVAECSGCLTDADSFEPRDAVKGDVARMVLYMAVRYDGGDGFADLEPNESTSNGSSPYTGKLSVLLQWNREDPPSAFEQRRNDVIFDTWQHNRNPFIDHPEWADAIW